MVVFVVASCLAKRYVQREINAAIPIDPQHMAQADSNTDVVVGDSGRVRVEVLAVPSKRKTACKCSSDKWRAAGWVK